MKKYSKENKNKALKRGLSGVIIVAIASTAIFYPYSSEYHVYMHGSANVDHDVALAELVDSDVSFGLYCSDIRPLVDTNEGDVYMSARADSYTCKYIHTDLIGIAVVGASNSIEDVGDERIPNSIYVSNGRAEGGAVDFIIFTGNLGDAMAYMANYIIDINLARMEAGLSTLTTDEMRYLFNAAATDKVIDMELALDYAVNGIPVEPIEPCPICAALAGGAIYLLLLDGD